MGRLFERRTLILMMLQTRQFHLISLRRVLALVVLTTLAVIASLFATRVFAADESATNDERLVTVHDGSSEVTVVTRAVTVADALQHAGIEISKADIVEPARTEKLVAQSYQINVFRARPVVVIDGLRTVRVMTAEQSPRQIAKAAGVTLYDEDTTKLQRVDDMLTSGGAGLTLTIDRATVFSLNLFGKTFTARTQAATIGELLKEKGITLGKNDGVRPGVTTPIADGMSVTIWRDGKQTVTVEERIKKPVEEIKDTSLAFGIRKVKTEGVDGKRNVTYEIEIKNGVEVGRKEIASVTTLEPRKEIVVVGMKIDLPEGSHTDWMAAAGIDSDDYGYVDFIISHESGWAPTKYNYAGSGAYGLCQALPASKMVTAGSDYMTNPITQLKWCNGYAVGRYGSWERAYNFWINNHWW